MTVKTLCEKLSQSIISILGSTVCTVYNLGNTLLCIILILNGSSVRKKYSAYKLSCGRGINFYVAIISFLYLKVKKNSAPQMKCGAKQYLYY